MINLADMTEEHWAKVRAILNDGGKFYVNPSDFDGIMNAAIKSDSKLVNALVANSFIERGTFVAAKAEDLKLQHLPGGAHE